MIHGFGCSFLLNLVFLQNHWHEYWRSLSCIGQVAISSEDDACNQPSLERSLNIPIAPLQVSLQHFLQDGAEIKVHADPRRDALTLRSLNVAPIFCNMLLHCSALMSDDQENSGKEEKKEGSRGHRK